MARVIKIVRVARLTQLVLLLELLGFNRYHVGAAVSE